MLVKTSIIPVPEEHPLLLAKAVALDYLFLPTGRDTALIWMGHCTDVLTSNNTVPARTDRHETGKTSQHMLSLSGKSASLHSQRRANHPLESTEEGLFQQLRSFFPACSWEMLPFSSQYLQYIRILRGRIRTWSASCLRQDKLETNPSVLTAFYEYKTGVSERRNRSINSTEFKNQCIIFSIMQRLDYITYIHTHIQFLKPLQEIREKLSRAYGNLTVCS